MREIRTSDTICAADEGGGMEVIMKQSYMKPMLAVETLSLDMPVAAGCEADKEDMLSLIELGYFLPDSTCAAPVAENGVVVPGEHDTICYHSNVIAAFLS